MQTNIPESNAATPESKGALLTKAELARFLQLTPRSVENLHARGLPFFRIGARRNRYDLAAVRAWLDRSCRIVRVN